MLDGSSKIHLVIQGCGFLGYYPLGAMCLLEQIWPQRPVEKISGASCGALLSVAIMSVDSVAKAIEISTTLFLKVRRAVVSPIKLMSIGGLARQTLELFLTDNVHKTIGNRIGISITRLHDWKNILVTCFESKADLIDAVICSCYIPIWAGLTIPVFRNTKCIDGCYTDNCPRIPLDPGEEASGVRHITITPFSGTSDVCPDDQDKGLGLWKVFGDSYYLNWSNFTRSIPAFIPHDINTMIALLKEGFYDMKSYLLQHPHLLRCNNCSIDSDAREDCVKCLLVIEKISNLKIPKHYIEAIKSTRVTVYSE